MCLLPITIAQAFLAKYIIMIYYGKRDQLVIAGFVTCIMICKFGIKEKGAIFLNRQTS